MQLYIIRHGETEENLRKILQGHLPGTLTREGRRQVEQTARQLAETGVDFRRIVTSDLRRAMDSAGIIARRLNLPVVTEPLLRERDWGHITGMTFAEARERFCREGKWTFPEDVETTAQLMQRGRDALARLLELEEDAKVIVVTHGHFARHMIASHLGCGYREVTPFDNAGVRVIDI